MRNLNGVKNQMKNKCEICGYPAMLGEKLCRPCYDEIAEEKALVNVEVPNLYREIRKNGNT